ncbi:MAG: pyridoxal phosphate-dependent aminotransferase [Bacteroidales bacterium]|nr:pyridoxal phosphate-dependent aminotransferase [Bacteroidales bacterium]
MKVYPEDLVRKHMGEAHISDLASASIGQMLGLAQKIEKATDIPFIHLEQGDPGLPANVIGLNAEIEALKRGVPGKYPSSAGLPELKEAGSRFIKAFLNVDFKPESVIPVSGTVGGSFMTILLLAQIDAKKNKILFIDPCFPLQQAQCRMLGVQWREFDIFSFRGPKLRQALEQELAHGDIAAIAYSNPNNPAWICLEDSELKIVAELADKYDAIVLEDQAYFCMDFRRDLSHPFKAPFAPSIANYTSNCIVMTSASKIFSYAGGRIGLVCISDKLYGRKYPALAQRYGNSGAYGPTFIDYVVENNTCGTSNATQWAYAAMLDASVEGKINFVTDMKEYGRRAERLKKIFTDNGFHIVYSHDVKDPIGDGFFFTVGYEDLSGAELIAQLMYYGVSCVNLANSGSQEKGLRICTSNMKEEDYPILEERLKAFNEDRNK